MDYNTRRKAPGYKDPLRQYQGAVNKAIAGALFPGMAKLIPAGQKMAAQKLDTLTRVKARLNELIEKEHSEAE